MKSSTQVIRVSAARARDSVLSLSSWLDTVQVRAADAGPFAFSSEPETPATLERGAAGAEPPALITCKLL